jgi:hypothetical protein
MPKYKAFTRENVSVGLVGEAPESWKFRRRVVQGTAYRYEVIDGNFSRPHRWEFIVRVPSRLGDDEYIEVRPIQCPSHRVFAGLDQRSVNFSPALRPSYRGNVYAKVFLGDATGEKTKRGVSAGDRPNLPAFISVRNMRLKRTVTTTAGSDGGAQVAVLKPTSHRGMIKFFLATRAWVLYNGFSLDDE